jgi:hypothetical protein
MDRHVVLLLCVAVVLGGLTVNALRSGEMSIRLNRIRRGQAPLAFNAVMILRLCLVLLVLGFAVAAMRGWLPFKAR